MKIKNIKSKYKNLLKNMFITSFVLCLFLMFNSISVYAGGIHLVTGGGTQGAMNWLEDVSTSTNAINDDTWVTGDSRHSTTAKEKLAACSSMDDIEKEKINIAQYKKYIGEVYGNNNYEVAENTDYVQDKNGKKFYAWVVRDCLVGYDMPSIIHTGSTYNTLVANSSSSFKYGTLVYLHRSPIYDLTLFVPSRYQWWYTNDPVNAFKFYVKTGSEDFVPDYNDLDNAHKTTIKNLGYTASITNIINNNISYYAPKFVLTYSPVPHVLGTEGLSGTSYVGKGGVFALMDEVNGMSVPVYINYEADAESPISGLTPFWSFTSPLLPNNSVHIRTDVNGNAVNFSQKDKNYGLWWKFEIEENKYGYTWLSSIINVDASCRNPNIPDAYIQYAYNAGNQANRENLCKQTESKAFPDGTIYGATQHEFTLPNGDTIGLGYRRELEQAIISMGGPLLVSSIDLAMDEALLQRNASVNFMQALQGNKVMSYGTNTIPDAGYAYNTKPSNFVDFYDYNQYTKNRNKIQNFSKAVGFTDNELAFLNAPGSGPIAFVGSEFTRLLSYKTDKYITSDPAQFEPLERFSYMSNTQNISASTQRKAFLSTAIGAEDPNHSGMYISGFRTIGVNAITAENHPGYGANFKTGNLTFIRGIGFRESTETDKRYASAKNYGRNIGYTRMPGKVYSSAIISVPTIIDIKEVYYYNDGEHKKGDETNRILFYPGFYNFYKNDEYTIDLIEEFGTNNDDVKKKLTTNNRVLDITYGYHSFYSFGRYGINWNWNDTDTAATLPNETNVTPEACAKDDGDPDYQANCGLKYLSTESHVAGMLGKNPNSTSNDMFGTDAQWSVFYSSEKNDDWGTWRSQGYLLSGNTWLSGSFPNDLNAYSNTLNYTDMSPDNTNIIVRYPWRQRGGFQSGYKYSKIFLEHYYAKTFKPNDMIGSWMENKDYYNKRFKILGSNEAFLAEQEQIYEQTLETMSNYILTDPLYLILFSNLTNRLSNYSDYLISTDTQPDYIDNNGTIFKERAYQMTLNGLTTKDRTTAARAFKTKIKSFENELCRRLTMKPLDTKNPAGCSDPNYKPYNVNGYGEQCVHKDFIQPYLSHNSDQPLLKETCVLSSTSLHKNSYSAFIEAGNESYPNSRTTYLEDLTYLFASFYSINELSSDFTIASAIRYSGGGDKAQYYFNIAAISGDFSNVTLLNDDTRLNGYLCSTNINNGSGCEGKPYTLFEKTSEENGTEVTVPRLKNAALNSSTNEYGDYGNRYGPELFMLNKLTGEYTTAKTETVTCRKPWKQVTGEELEGYKLENQILCRKDEILPIEVKCPQGENFRYDGQLDICIEDVSISMECETGFRPFLDKCIKLDGTEVLCEGEDNIYNKELGICIKRTSAYCSNNFTSDDYDFLTGVCHNEQDLNSCIYGGEIIDNKCVVPIPEFKGVKEEENVLYFGYTGKLQPVLLKKGKYMIEAWGAEGGSSANVVGGAYVKGTLDLDSDTTIYVNVGGTPKDHKGGYNGGGTGASDNSNTTYEINGKVYKVLGYGGGGATDVRITTDPKSRILIAGGAGGSAKINVTDKATSKKEDFKLDGGGGGGYNGQYGEYRYDDVLSKLLYGGGADTNNPGKNIFFSGQDPIEITYKKGTLTKTYQLDPYVTSDSAVINGSATSGGSTTTKLIDGVEYTNYYPVAGGGGGYYGGSAGLSAGGGSSFIYAKNNGKEETYGVFQKEYSKYAGYLTEKYALYDTDIRTSDGVTLMPLPNGSIGYAYTSSNGYVKITNLSTASNIAETCDHLYYVKESKWNEETNQYEVTVKDRHDTHTAKLMSMYIGASELFSFAGQAQEYVVPIDGKYMIEAWGAQGGNSISGTQGGKGGYSTTVMDLKKNDKLYLYVGGQGKTGSKFSEVSGGFNGGGKASIGGGGSGGGATDVRLYEDSLANRIIVAGGGGGAGVKVTDTGGFGGGAIAGVGANAFYSPATSINGYVPQGADTIKDPTTNLPIAAKTNEGASNLVAGGGAGGGGFYGGYSGFTYGGGGGSGYIDATDEKAYMLDGDSIFYSTKAVPLEYQINDPVIDPSIDIDNFQFELSIKGTIISSDYVSMDDKNIIYLIPEFLNTNIKGCKQQDTIGCSIAELRDRGIRIDYTIEDEVNISINVIEPIDSLEGDGTYEHGHAGNGAIRITAIELYDDTWQSEDKSYQGELVGNKPQIPNTIQDKTTVLIKETVAIDEVFEFTGEPQEITLQKGEYTFQLYGASGGKGYGNDDGSVGLGGYTEGTIEVNAPTKFYLYVGGKGDDGSSNPSQGGWTAGDTNWDIYAGNGGWVLGQSYGGGGGGGATIISTKKLKATEIDPPTGTFAYAYRSKSKCDYRNPILCSNKSTYNGYHSTSHNDWERVATSDRKFYKLTNESLQSILLIAGGGGGSPAINSASKEHQSNYRGGAGGGPGAQLLGTDGVGLKWDSTGKLKSTSYINTVGLKGTMTAGGAGGKNSNNKQENGVTNGGQIFGGDGASGTPSGGSSSTTNAAYGSGGGGAGYYGGGGGSYYQFTNSSSYSAGGGGGSGYANSSKFTERIEASSLTQRTPGQYSGITGQNKGNGYIRIKGKQREGSTEVITLKRTDMVEKEFKFNNNNIQTVTLKPGEYTISAWGAKGGGASGGLGAFSTSTVNLTQTTTLKILVGGRGQDRTDGPGGSGGGGTFVSTSNNVPLVVAGGGGGSGINSSGTITNASGSIYVENTDQESKVSFGGWASNDYQTAGAGGGYYSNGEFNYTNGKGSGGHAFVNGGIPGYTTTTITGDLLGGFGGGGGTANANLGGGGGGYTGGTAGHIIDGDTSHSAGSGGSSYFFGQGFSVPGGELQPTIDGAGYTQLGNSSEDYNGYVIIKGIETAKAGNGESSLSKVDRVVSYETNNAHIGKTVTVSLDPGTYILEAWGAEGGKSQDGTSGGKGGYSTGTITLTEKTDLYVTAGKAGNRTIAGTNGGGQGIGTSGAGGDASDIRIGGNTIYNRFLVAGGGAGASNKIGTEISYPGVGGGSTASDSQGSSSLYGKNNEIHGTAGSSSSPGVNGPTITDGFAPIFGQGGYSFDTSVPSAGGGGGWFGGGAASEYGVASGGSGFVFTSSTKNIAHSIPNWSIAESYIKTDSEGNEMYDDDGNPIMVYKDSKYYLKNAQTKSGKNSIPVKTNTNSYEIGNSGNGYIKITKLLNADYSLKEDSIQNIIDSVNKVGYFEAIDFIKEFSYTGAVEKVTLEPGSYYVEAWGAEGGSSKTPDGLITNGKKGEHSFGVITVEEATDVYVYVGGAAGDATNGYKGGYNGGANGSSNLNLDNPSYTYWAGGGGGASEVRFVTNDSNNRAVVAAGGDGADARFRIGNNIFGTTVRVQGGYSGGFKTPETKSFVYSTKQRYNVEEERTNELGETFTEIVEAMTDTTTIVPEGYNLNDKFLLTSAIVHEGNEYFRTVNNKDELELGHSGNGFVRIQRVRPIIKVHPEVKTNLLAKNTEYYQYTGYVQSAILDPGTYIIQTWGSIGGDGRELFDYSGGLGAYSTSTIQVFDRTEINVLVGRAGYAESDYTGAGGGGSFVSTSTGIPLAIAGAGGGAGRTNPLNTDSYKHGQGTEISGIVNTNIVNLSNILVPGYGGYVNNDSTSHYTAGSGGGFYGDGKASLIESEYGLGSGGRSFIYSGMYGYEFDGGTPGGYGSGGGTANEYTGGGGGGYTGGSSGIYNTAFTSPTEYIGLSGAGGGSYHTNYGYSVAGNSSMPSFYVTNFNNDNYNLHTYNQMTGNQHDGIVMITKVTDEILEQYASEYKETGLLDKAYSETGIKHFTNEYFERENIQIDFVDYAGKTNDLLSNTTGDIELLPGDYLVEMWGASNASAKGAYLAINLNIHEKTDFQYWTGKQGLDYIKNEAELKDSRTGTTYLYNLKDNQIVGYVGDTLYKNVEGYHHYSLDEMDETMPSPKGGYEKNGHIGDGNIRITVLNITSDNDRIDLREGYGYTIKQPKNKRVIYYCGLYYKGGTDQEIVHQYETSFKQNFAYSGKSEEVKLEQGLYKLEAWGAQGGTWILDGWTPSTNYNSYGSAGGRGGYASGYLAVNNESGMTIYVTVGNMGITGEYKPVTFNGGGGTRDINRHSYNRTSGTGGGATHFSLMSGELKDHEKRTWKNNYSYTITEDNKDKILLVAAGGAGRSHTNNGGIANGEWTGGTCQVESQKPSGSRSLYSGQFGQGGTAYSHGGGGGGGYCAGMGNSSCGGNGYGGYGYVNRTLNSTNSPFYIEEGIVKSGGETFASTDGLTNEEGHAGAGYAKITGVKYRFESEHIHVSVDTFIEYSDAGYKYDLTCADGYTFNDITQKCEREEFFKCFNADTGAVYNTIEQWCINTNNDIACTNGAKPTVVDNKYVCAFFKTPTCPTEGYTPVDGRCQLTTPRTGVPDKCYGQFKVNTEDVTISDGTTFNPGTVCHRTLYQTLDTVNNNTFDPVKASPLEGEEAIVLLDNIYSYRNYITYKPSHIRGAFFLLSDEKFAGPNGEYFTGEPLMPQVSTEIWLSTAEIKESYCVQSGECTPDQYKQKLTNGITISINPNDLFQSGTDNNNINRNGTTIGLKNNPKYKLATDPNYGYSQELSSRVWSTFANVKNKVYSSLDFKEKFVMVDFIFQITEDKIKIMNRATDAIPKINPGENVDTPEWAWDREITWTQLVNEGLINYGQENLNKFFRTDGTNYYLKLFDNDENGDYRQIVNTIAFSSSISSFKIVSEENVNIFSKWLYEQTGSNIHRDNHIFVDNVEIDYELDNYVFSNTFQNVQNNTEIKSSNAERKLVSFLTGDTNLLDNTSLYVTQISQSSSDIFIDRVEVITNGADGEDETVYAFEAITEERCEIEEFNQYTQVSIQDKYIEHPTTTKKCKIYDFAADPLSLDSTKNYRFKVYTLWDRMSFEDEHPIQTVEYLDITSNGNSGAFSFAEPLTKRSTQTMEMRAKSDEEDGLISENKAVVFSAENTHKHFMNKDEEQSKILLKRYYSDDDLNGTFINDVYTENTLATPLFLPLSKVNNPKYRDKENELNITQVVSDGYVVFSISSRNKLINKLELWDSLTIFYNLNICKVDNKIEIVTKCRKYLCEGEEGCSADGYGPLVEVPTIKNGCFIIRTDDTINAIDRFIVDKDHPCEVYAKITRVSGNDCETTGNVAWSTNDNKADDLNVSGNWYKVKSYCLVNEQNIPYNVCPNGGLIPYDEYDHNNPGYNSQPNNFESNPNYTPYVLINTGDTNPEDSIFIRYLDGAKSYYQVNLNYGTDINGNYYDTNLSNNNADACWSFSEVDYQVTNAMLSPKKIDVVNGNGVKTVTFTGQYDIARIIDLKQNERDITVSYHLYAPNATKTGQEEICTIENAAEITGDEYDNNGNPIEKVPSTSKTVNFKQPYSNKTTYQTYKFKFDCQIDQDRYDDGEQYILYIDINGGKDPNITDTTIRTFEESEYAFNRTSTKGIFYSPQPPKPCLPPGGPEEGCTNINNWRLNYDFVYETNRKIDEYETNTDLYMSWVDYDVLNKSFSKEESMNGGTDSYGGYPTNKQSAGHTGWRASGVSELNYSKQSGANGSGTYVDGGFDGRDDKVYVAPISGNGNEIRAPWNYLAYQSHVTYATGDGSKNGYAPLNLCTDYRNNNEECWRYERNVYHTIFYYNRTTIKTKTYPTHTTLLSEYTSDKKASGSWDPDYNKKGNTSCSTHTKDYHSTKALNYGTNTRNNYGKTGGELEYEGSYGSQHTYANSTCYTGGLISDQENRTDLGFVETNGYNKTEISGCANNRAVCHGFNTSPNARECDTIYDWWGNKICNTTERIYADEADSGNFPNDYIDFKNFGNNGASGTNHEGYSGHGYEISDHQNRSTTTMTNRVIIQQTRTQGSANPGWTELRSQEVCTARSYTTIGFHCPTYYTYGTYGKSTNKKSITSNPKIENNSQVGISTRVFYCNNNSCSSFATQATPASTNQITNSTLTMSDHTYLVCNNEGSNRPTSAVTEPIGYGDSKRACYWISDEYTPGKQGVNGNFVWWNTASQTCYREHRDWTCKASISEGGNTARLSSSEDVTNSGNNYGATCEWERKADWEAEDCELCCAWDKYGNCTEDCTYDDYDPECPEIMGLSGKYHGSNPGCNAGTDSSGYCTYTKKISNERNVTYNDYTNGNRSVNKYATVNCSDGDLTEDFKANGDYAPLCYQTTSDTPDTPTDQRCIRWKTEQYKEIKYYSSEGAKIESFNTRNYGYFYNNGGKHDVKLRQYSCDRRLIEGGLGDKYPDQQTLKDYTESFSVQLYIKTDRSGKWIAVPDGGNLSSDLVPRAGEYFDIKAVSNYSTTRGQKPYPIPFLSEYYNNYHNDKTFNPAIDKNQYYHDDGLLPTKESNSDPYEHWGQCSSTRCKSTSSNIQDLVNNEDYGYCDAKIAEPYGCSYKSYDSIQFASIGDRNDNDILQGQNLVLWNSNKNPTNGYCFYGPDNWPNLSTARSIPYDGLFGDDITAELTVRRTSANADEVITYVRKLVPNGGCKSKAYSLCTEYETTWSTLPVVAANGSIVSGFYVEVDDNKAPWEISFSHEWFDGVAKFEQDLLGESGPEAFWGYNGSENSRYFNLINNTPIYKLCDCATLNFQNKGEVAWASSEWEVS